MAMVRILSKHEVSFWQAFESIHVMTLGILQKVSIYPVDFGLGVWHEQMYS